MTRRLLLLLAFFLAAAARAADIPASSTAPVPAPPPTDYQKPRLQAAAGDLDRNDPTAARAKAKETLRENKKSPEAWTVLGRSFLAESRYKKAVRRFNKAIKFDPRYAPAYYWLGRAYEAWGRQDEAANEYQAAFRADPRLAAAREAWTRLQDGRPAPEE